MIQHRVKPVLPAGVIWEPSIRPLGSGPHPVIDHWIDYLVQTHVLKPDTQGFGGHLALQSEISWFKAIARGAAMRLKNTLGLMIGSITAQPDSDGPTVAIKHGQVVVGGFDVVNLRVLGDLHLHNAMAFCRGPYLYSNIMAEQRYAEREQSSDPRAAELWGNVRKLLQETLEKHHVRRKAS